MAEADNRGVPAIIRWDQAYTRNGDGKLPRAVVHAIRTYMDNWTLAGFVRAETLARDTGLTIRQVRRHIAANVAAGWLEVTDSGNSSGKANDYLLTYPKRDEYVTQRVTDMSVKGDRCVTPTTPRTSPSTSPKRSTSPKKGVTDDTLATDPFRGSGGIVPAYETTGQSNGDIYVTLPPQPSSPWGDEPDF